MRNSGETYPRFVVRPSNRRRKPRSLHSIYRFHRAMRPTTYRTFARLPFHTADALAEIELLCQEEAENSVIFFVVARVASGTSTQSARGLSPLHPSLLRRGN